MALHFGATAGISGEGNDEGSDVVRKREREQENCFEN
jgi:hypothetical protein